MNMRQAVNIATLWQQPLWPEANEKHEHYSDHDPTQGRNDIWLSRHIREEACRLLDQYDHDKYAQYDTFDIPFPTNENGRVKNDCFDGRPGRRVKGTQV